MSFNKTPWFDVIAQDSSKALVTPKNSVEGIIDCNGIRKYLNLAIKIVSVFGNSTNGNVFVYIYCFDADNASESDTIPIYSQEIKRVPNTEQILTIPDLHVSAVDSVKVKIVNDSSDQSINVWSSCKALYSSNLSTSFDEKTKVSITDVQSDFLFDKLVGQENKIDLTILNQGNNETINIDVQNDRSQWNASKIKDVPVDDSNIDDKNVLIYDQPTNTLKYVNVLDLALSIDTTSFGKELSSIEDTVQDALNKLDDHVHEADETGATITNFDHRLTGNDDTVQKALDTLDNYVEIASETTVVTTGFTKELTSAEDTVQKALDKLDDHVHEADETGATTTEFNHRLSAADDTVQKALDTLDNYVEIASETTVVTTGFTKELTSSEDTVQKALDKLDNHVHEADETGATTTEFNHRLSAADDTVQKALDTLDNYVEIASETTVVTTGFTKELTSAEDTVQKALDKLDDHVHEANETGATTTNFNQVLTSNDNTVQKALDTLDDYSYEQYWENESLFATTSQTYVQSFSITTDVLIAGNYMIDYMISLSTNYRDEVLNYRIQVDNTTNIVEATQGRTDNDIYDIHSGFRRLALSAGTHTIDIDIRGDGTQVRNYSKRIRIRRVK